MRKLIFAVPLLVVIALGIVFLFQLDQRDECGVKTASHLPSPLLGKPLPEFSLPRLEDSTLLSSADLPKQPFFVNVWATWCPSCKVEHPYLLQMQQAGALIVGVNYKDERSKALQWLQVYQSPYSLNIFDQQGRYGLDLGVYGAPETYLVDATNTVQYKHVGEITACAWEKQLKPRWQALREG